MFLTLVFLFFSIIGIGASFPIAQSHHISYFTIFTDYFSFLTFCGVTTGFLLLLFRFIFSRKFNPNWKIFTIPKYEIKFYEKIKVKKWHNIIPDLGGLVGFKKNLNEKPVKNAEFYYRFLYENVNAEALHGFSIIFSPIFFVFLNPAFYSTIGICCLLIVVIGNLMPVIIQRYNRPRLQRLYNKLAEKEKHNSDV